jgi:hypothetical protein
MSVAPGLNYSTTAADGSRETGLNNGDGTFTVTRYASDGTIVSVDTLTGLPIEPLYPPLDPTGALATLLVVLNVVPLADAANAIHEEQAHPVAEAEAWSLGS